MSLFVYLQIAENILQCIPLKDKNMAEKKTQKGGFRKKLLTFATFLSTIIPSAAVAKDAPQQDNDNADKIVTVVPTRKIDYQVDTLDNVVNYGAYSGDKNTITLSYQKIPGAHYDLPEDFLAMSLIHEQKHRDNREAGIRKYPVSPEQAYKLDMHNEISANIAELIYIRDKYLKTGDTKILEISPRFYFYKEAIEQGIINPKSEYREDFDKEMSLIVNGVIKMWHNNVETAYSKQNANNAFNNSDHVGSYSEFHDENYQKCLELTYKIAGVDFSQYIEKDVEVPEVGKKRLNYLLAQSYVHVKSTNNQEASERFHLPAYDGNLTIDEYRNLLRHAIVIQHMSIAEKTPQDYMDSLATAYVKKEKTAEDIAKEYEKSFDVVDEYFYSVVEGMIDRISSEAYNGDIKIPRKSKDKGAYYTQVLEKLYTAHIEVDGKKEDVNLFQILNPNDKMPFSDLYDLSNGFFVKEKNNKKVSATGLPKPKYRQWKDKDGERVSEVLYFETIDTSRESIIQPKKSYISEAKDNIAEFMKNPTENLLAMKKRNGYE